MPREALLPPVIGYAMRRYRALIPALLFFFSLAGQAQLDEQSVSGNGVMVTVAPGNLPASAQVWEFNVALNTHSQDLTDDLLNAAVLSDGKGREFKPLAWDGSGPGGHHRRGVLKFKAMAPRPQAIELRILRPGDASPRIFRWRLE